MTEESDDRLVYLSDVLANYREWLRNKIGCTAVEAMRETLTANDTNIVEANCD